MPRSRLITTRIKIRIHDAGDGGLRYVEISCRGSRRRSRDDAQLKTYYDEQKVKTPERLTDRSSAGQPNPVAGRESEDERRSGQAEGI